MTEFKKEDVLKGISKIMKAVDLSTTYVIQYFQSGGKEVEQESEKPIDEIVAEICNEK